MKRKFKQRNVKSNQRKQTEERIVAIRSDYLYNGLSFRDLTYKYDMYINSIAKIIRYITYREILPELKEDMIKQIYINKHRSKNKKCNK